MSRRARLGGVAACALLVSLPMGAGAESLQSELSGLVETNPQIQSRVKTVSAKGEGIRASKAGYLPTVKASADTGPEYVDSPTRRSVEGEPFYKGRETSSLTVTQKLFDGFATDTAVEQAGAELDSAGAELRAIRQSTMLEGTTAYLDVLKQTRLIALARDNERKVMEQMNLEDERVRKGSGVASDVLAAKQRLSTAKEARVRFEGEFQNATARYTQAFGHAPDVAELTDPPLPVDLLPDSLADALKIAEKENPQIEQALRTVDISAAKKRNAESGYFPTLDLVGKTNYENDKNATLGVRRDWSVLLQANWELFSGFKTDAQVAQASWEQAANKDTHLYTGMKIAAQVRTAWSKLDTARRRLELLENASVLAEEVLAAQQKKREAGKATVQDVLDEETRVNESRINYTTAYYDMYQAAYDLLTAIGRFEPEYLARATALTPAVSPAVLDTTVRQPAEPSPAPPAPVERSGQLEAPASPARTVAYLAPPPAAPRALHLVKAPAKPVARKKARA